MEGNWRWVAVDDNRDNLIFSQEKIFSSYNNVVIPAICEIGIF